VRGYLVAAAALIPVLALTAGCGGKRNGSTTAIASTEVHESASAAAPTPTPTATAAPPPVCCAPPSPNNKSGYVWVDQAAATYTVTNNYKYNSVGGQIHVQHAATGSYVVIFDGIGVAGGVAHASSYGSNSNFCTIVSWYQSGSDQKVEVKCFTATAAPVDTTFLVNFASGHWGLTKFSYLWADQPATVSYEPFPNYRYDSSGATPKVKRLSPGRYQVYLPASADLGGEPYSLQVSAYGSVAMHCKVSAAFVAAATHQIDCRRTTGVFADTQFEVTFASNGNFIGRDDLRFGEYGDASPGVVVNSTGVYTVPANEMGQPKGQVVAYAEGGDTTYCHTGSWAPSGTTLNMVVRCFSFDGSPFESSFRVMVSW
jgi:hypothetical protein